MKTVGETLKQIRKSRKLTQIELAKRAAISRTYLSDVENNRYNPSIPFLKKVSKVLESVKVENTRSLNDVYSALMEAAGFIEEKSDIEKLTQALQIIQNEYAENLTIKQRLIDQKEEATNTPHDNDNSKELNKLDEQIEVLRYKEAVLQKLLYDAKDGNKIDNLDETIFNLLDRKGSQERNFSDSSKINFKEFKSSRGDANHKITFSIPAYKEITKNGTTITSYLTTKEAIREFYNIENLLKLGWTNYNGHFLSQNDIEKILSKIEEIKDEFEYLD